MGHEVNSTFLYVTDAGNNRVEKFFINGTFVLKWGSQGTFNGAFFRPMAVAVGNKRFSSEIQPEESRSLIPMVSSLRNGELWAPWSNNFLIYLELPCLKQPNLTPPTGQILKQIEEGKATMIAPRISNPLFTQANQNGNSSIVFVTDSDNNRIQEFFPNGTFIRKFGTLGQLDGQFNRPNAITIFFWR